jgi:hypothetical protein
MTLTHLLSMKKKFFLNTLFFFAFFAAYGQNENHAQDVVPKIISPPPNAASLGKYGQIPVGLANGIPSVSIPIYDIKSGSLSLPISLNYHAAGVKVDEVASMCGLSWSLSAGGVITRTVIGLPDDTGYLMNKPPLANEIDVNTAAYATYLHQVAKLNSTDSQPDLYFFNFTGKSGKFIFGEDNQPILIPNQNINVEHIGGNFKITNDDGTIYWFEEKESVTSGMYGGSGDQTTVNSWYLTRILSHDGIDVINLSYKNDIEESYEYNCLFSEAIGGTVISGNSTVSQEPAALSGISYRRYMQKLPDEITFTNGEIEFVTDDDRLDQGVSRLSGIKVWETHGTPTLIKETRLKHDYFVSADKQKQFPDNEQMRYRLKLVSVYDLSLSGDMSNEYKMEYNESIPLSPVNGYGQDVWGFNNGLHSNETLIEKKNDIVLANLVWNVGNADRSVRATYMKAGVLTKLHYPTGGYTEFEFEPHSYEFSGTTITSKSHSTRAMGASPPDIPGNTFTEQTSISRFTVDNNVITAIIVEATLSKYAYPNVTERPWVKIRAVATGQDVYIVYAHTDGNQSFHSVQEVYLTPGDEYELVAYAQGNYQVTAAIDVRYSIEAPVEEIRTGGGLRIRKLSNFDGQQKHTSKTYTYSPGKLLSNWKTFVNSTQKIVQFGISDVNLICAEIYSHHKRVRFASSTTYSLENFNGSPVGYRMVTEYEGEDTALGNNGKTEYSYLVVPNSYIMTPPEHLEGGHALSNSWETGQLEKETKYRFDKTDLQYKKIFETTYKNRKVLGGNGRGLFVGTKYEIAGCYFPEKTTQYYWFDYPIRSGRYVVDSVITREFTPEGEHTVTSIAYTYDQVRYMQTDEVVLQSNGELIKTTNKYPHDFPSDVACVEMVNRNIVTPVIEKIRRNQTRNIELSRTKTEYGLWHNNTLIEPKLIQQAFGGNTLQTEVVMNDYDNKGNTLQYTTKNGIVTTFIWGYNNALPVAKILGVPSATVQTMLDNGSIDRSIVDNPASDLQLRTELAKLRNIFPEQQISTFTYSPMKGLSSSTDENGVTTFYEFDDFNRLKLIRDQFNNIVKKYEYNLKMK